MISECGFCLITEVNGKTLRKVFDMDVTETDVTVALTEHLLKALSPGEFCKVDSKSKDQEPCRCGCKKKAYYDKTTIGKETQFCWISISVLEVTFSQKSKLDICKVKCYE